MNRILAPVVLSALVFQSGVHWDYPPTKTVDATDTYFGKTYKDPYRWLENLKDKEVEAWFKAQAELTDSVLAKIPARDSLAQEWMALDKLNPQVIRQITTSTAASSTKRRSAARTSANSISERDGMATNAFCSIRPPSHRRAPSRRRHHHRELRSISGRALCRARASRGGRRILRDLRGLDVDRGTSCPRASIRPTDPFGWTMDSKSFFYDAGKVTDIKSLEIELNRKTRLHTLGTDVSADIDFFSNESYPDLGIAAKEMPVAVIDESYPDYVVGIASTVQSEMRLFYAPVSQMKPAASSDGRCWRARGQSGPRVRLPQDEAYAVTHAGAPKYKLVRTQREPSRTGSTPTSSCLRQRTRSSTSRRARAFFSPCTRTASSAAL